MNKHFLLLTIFYLTTAQAINQIIPLTIENFPSHNDSDKDKILNLYPSSTLETVIGTKTIIDSPNKSSIKQILSFNKNFFNEEGLRVTMYTDENNKFIKTEEYESFDELIKHMTSIRFLETLDILMLIIGFPLVTCINFKLNMIK